MGTMPILPHVVCACMRCWLVARVALVALLLWVPWPTFALELTARLSPTSIQLNEQVELILETDAPLPARPDLSELAQDFRELDRRTQSSISTINGRTVEHHRLIVTLSPKRAGLLEIPPIIIGAI